MNTMILLAAGGSLFYATCLTPSKPFKKLEVDVTVRDEQGNPVEGAHVRTSYLHWIARSPVAPLLLPFKERQDPFQTAIIRYTNANGISKLRFHTWSPGARIGITKDGYYSSIVQLQDRRSETSTTWTRTPQKITARLREIRNPVALITSTKYALDFQIQSEEPVGFDFMLEDWMPPYGKGEVQDAVIKVTPFPLQGLGSLVSICEITFQGEDNGIQGIPAGMIFSESTLIYPHEAFEDGYTNQYLRVESFVKKTTTAKAQKINLDADYFFIRLRTQKDEDGNIISANYGVVLYPINAGGRDNFRRVRMSYLINPIPNDRNLEPARNERGQIIPYTGDLK